MLSHRRIFTPLNLFIRHFQVTILGAATDVGQTVSLLLRSQPGIDKLVTHDFQPHSPGVHLDISHIPGESVLVGYSGEDTIDSALYGADMVIVTGDLALKPTWTAKSCFTANATFIKKVSARIARATPTPLVAIVAEPINSMVPMAAEVMRNHGYCDNKKMFGITGIDLLRAQCLYGMENRRDPLCCYVPVIGGHSEKTTIPLLSHAKPVLKLEEKQILAFTDKIRKGDDIVTRAKMGRSPTLAVAYSVLVFVNGTLNALKGHTNCKVQAYVHNTCFGTDWFSGLVTITKEGAGEMQRYSNLSEYECYLLRLSIDELKKDITRGKRFLEMGTLEVD